MKNEIRKSANIILKVLNSLSENSLRDDHNSPSTETTSDVENTISVEPASHGLNSDIDPNESFIGAQPNIHDLDHEVFQLFHIYPANSGLLQSSSGNVWLSVDKKFPMKSLQSHCSAQTGLIAASLIIISERFSLRRNCKN